MSTTPRNKNKKAAQRASSSKSHSSRSPVVSPSTSPRFTHKNPVSPSPARTQPAQSPPTTFLVTPAPPPANCNARPHHLRILVNVADALARGWQAGAEVWIGDFDEEDEVEVGKNENNKVCLIQHTANGCLVFLSLLGLPVEAKGMDIDELLLYRCWELYGRHWQCLVKVRRVDRSPVRYLLGVNKGLFTHSPFVSAVQLTSLLRQNANLKLGAFASISKVTTAIAEAGRIVLRPSAQHTFPIDEMLSIYAKEILGTDLSTNFIELLGNKNRCFVPQWILDMWSKAVALKYNIMGNFASFWWRVYDSIWKTTN